MKRFPILFPAGFLLLLTACQSREQAVSEEPSAGRVLFHAEVEVSAAPDAKVYMDAGFHTYWNADDRISVFPKKTDNLPFRFLGNDGDKSGNFTNEESYVGDGALAKYYAASPYRADNTLSTEGVLGMTLPATQAYREESFDPAAQLMAAVSDTRSFSFRNVCCLLGFQLRGDGVRVSSLSMTSNGGEPLSGKILVTPGDAPAMVFDGTGSATVSMTFTSPVELHPDTPTPFWLILPPATLESGFTLTVTDEDGGSFVKQLSRSITFERNKAHQMAALEVVPIPPGPPTSFGIFPDYHTTGTPYVYHPETDQISIYEAEGQAWVRFITLSTLRMHEIGPIPADVAEGDSVNLTWTETLSGAAVRSADYTVEVLSLTGGVLTLSVEDTYFVLRF